MIILITGGTRSGKSGYGEQLLKDEDKILYLATAMVTDEEMERRVEHHRKRRGERYITIEGHKNIPTSIKNSSYSHSLFDCVGTTVTNLLFDACKDFEQMTQDKAEEIESDILQYFKEIIVAMRAKQGKQIIISNEVGMSLISEYRLGRIFTDILGRVNQYLASQSDEVILMVSGIPVNISQKS